MWVLELLCLTYLVLFVHGLNFNQHKYIAQQDDLTFDLIDHEFLDVIGGLSKFNDTTNVVNATLKINKALPNNLKFSIKAFKWVGDKYRDSVVQIEKPVQEILEMEMFDLQSLWVTHARPPLIWPLEKGVTYNLVGWNPDSTQFPPNIPEGRYKVLLQLSMPNKRKLAIVYWFARAVYIKH